MVYSSFSLHDSLHKAKCRICLRGRDVPLEASMDRREISLRDITEELAFLGY